MSFSERQYQLTNAALNLREDGREVQDIRPLYFLNNCLPHTNGSCRITRQKPTIDNIDHSDNQQHQHNRSQRVLQCDILCSVKLDIRPISSSPAPTSTLTSTLVTDKVNKARRVTHSSTPSTSSKSLGEGLIEFDIDISPSATSSSASALTSSATAEQALLISQHLERLYATSNSLNWKQLEIIPNKYTFVIVVDLMVVEFDGDLLELCSIAAAAALSTTIIPTTTIARDEHGVDIDFDVVGDVDEDHAIQLDTSNVPVCIVAHQLGDVILLDASLNELVFSSCAVAVAYNRNINVSNIIKLNDGAFNINSQLPHILKLTKDSAKGIFEGMKTNAYDSKQSTHFGYMLL